MPSQRRSTREAQKLRCEGDIKRLVAALQGKGLDSATIRRNPAVRKLKARLKQIENALLTIAKLEKRKEALALRKKEKEAQRLAKREEKAGKSKAQAAAAGEKKPKKEKIVT